MRLLIIKATSFLLTLVACTSISLFLGGFDWNHYRFAGTTTKGLTPQERSLLATQTASATLTVHYPPLDTCGKQWHVYARLVFWEANESGTIPKGAAFLEVGLAIRADHPTQIRRTWAIQENFQHGGQDRHGHIPFGSPVRIDLNILPEEQIRVEWEWGESVDQHIVSVPGWESRYGLAPMQVEFFSPAACWQQTQVTVTELFPALPKFRVDAPYQLWAFSDEQVVRFGVQRG